MFKFKYRVKDVYNLIDSNDYIIKVILFIPNKTNIFGDPTIREVYLYYDNNIFHEMNKGAHYHLDDGGSQKIELDNKWLTVPHNRPEYGGSLPFEYHGKSLLLTYLSVDLYGKLDSYINNKYSDNINN